MRIATVETVPFALPFRETYRTASGELDRRESALIRLRSDDGPEGLGEAVPLSLRGGASLVQVREEIEAAGAAELVGVTLPDQVLDASALIRRLLDRCRQRRISRVALCGIDIALHDLAAKAAGTGLGELIGVREQGPVPCNGTIGAVDAAAARRAAAELAEDGFASIKVKVGVGDDAARIAAVREATEPGAVIRVDANGSWTAGRAIEMDWTLAPLELIEQPCSDLEGLARVRAATHTPIVADESIVSFGQAERSLTLNACNATTAKLSKVGGIREAMRISEILPTYMSSALDGPVGIAAAAHCAGALPSIGYAHGLATASLFADAPAAWPEIESGSVTAPAGPGLGIEIDEDALERLRIR